MSQTTETPSADVNGGQNQGEILTGHTYDDIQEYDNPTPGWWKWLFAATVFYSIGYLMIFELGTAPDIQAQYDNALAEDLRARFAEIGDLAADEATILRYMDDQEWLQVGASTYKGKCAPCHGSQGEGLNGPNLTDDYYKNVKNLEDIAKVISEGAANGAMPPWQSRLHPNELVLTAAYVATLRETDLGSAGKKPEGEIIPPWPTPDAAAPAENEDESDESIDEEADE